MVFPPFAASTDSIRVSLAAYRASSMHIARSDRHGGLAATTLSTGQL